MRDIAIIALAGAIGTLCRYGLGSLVHRILGTNFPFGTLMINFLGCLTIGFVMHIGLNTTILSRSMRVGLTIGFLGAFTTFSTFGYETFHLFEDGLYWAALMNIALNVVLGLIAVITGFSLGRLVIGGI